jgi:hypothetical protein
MNRQSILYCHPRGCGIFTDLWLGDQMIKLLRLNCLDYLDSVGTSIPDEDMGRMKDKRSDAFEG